MTDQDTGGLTAGSGSAADPFTQALFDIAAGRRHDAANLPQEDQDLLAAVTDWLPELPTALAEFAADEADSESAGPRRREGEVRSDDPIALMLGLIEDPAVRLDGRRLAAVRKAAGLDIAAVAERLNRRGWHVTIKAVSAWERGRTNPPPATINALAEELDVSSDALLSASAKDTPTIDTLFDDATVAAFLDDWALEANVPVEALTEHSKRLLATAGKRNATSTSPATLLAVLRHFKQLPRFEISE